MAIDQFEQCDLSNIERPKYPDLWNMKIGPDREIWGRRDDELKRFTGSGSSPVPAGPTLFVSVDGDNDTGEIGRRDLPFKDMQGVIDSGLAVPGTTVVFLPGNYTVPAEWLFNNVFYYFYPGAVITCNSDCIYDNGINKKIRILGYGTFISLNGSGVRTDNQSTELFVECATIIGGVGGAGVALLGGKSLTVKCLGTINCDALGSYGIRVSVNDNFYIECQNLQCPNSNAAIYIRNCCTDGFRREAWINIKRNIFSNANRNFAAIRFENSGNLLLYLNANINHNLTSPVSYLGGLFALDGGRCIYTGRAESNGGYGVTFLNVASGGLESYLKCVNAEFYTPLQSIRLNSLLGVFESYASKHVQTNDLASPTPAVEVGIVSYFGSQNGGQFYIGGDSVIINTVNNVLSYGMLIDGVQECFFGSSKIITANPGVIESIHSNTPQTIYPNTYFGANGPLGASVNEPFGFFVQDTHYKANYWS
jgi:hypothetical protein